MADSWFQHMLSELIEAKLQKLQGQFEKRLDAYIDSPDNAKNVHDIRTSLRRLDSMFLLFSKRIRNSNRKRIAKYWAFFKPTSDMRDCDIIISKLALLSPDFYTLSVGLRRKRDRELKRVARKAKALRKVRAISATGMSSDELETRIDKVTTKLCERIKENLSHALSDSENVKQLHSLRKDLKKLRYILETVDNHAVKKIEKKIQAAGIPADIELLEKLQDELGEIHDSDITLQYLRSSKSKIAKELHAKEAIIRESRYMDFVEHMRSILATYSKLA